MKAAAEFLSAAENARLDFWLKLAVVCTGLALRCSPWLKHAQAWCSRRGHIDVFGMICSFNQFEQLSGQTLSFYPSAFAPRRVLGSGKSLRPTTDVAQVTADTLLSWFRKLRSAGYSSPLNTSQIRDMLRLVLPNGWKLNDSHFRVWLQQLGLSCVQQVDEDDESDPLVSSTNGAMYLALCRLWGWPHSYESLHESCQEALLSLQVSLADGQQLRSVMQNLKPEDTPGNVCKLISCMQTWLYGVATNETSHDVSVGPSSLQESLKQAVRFRS